MKQRCLWSQGNTFNMEYHDTEWGVPVHDDRKLFEFLVLDAFQAGLSWVTILKKRENFRLAFDNFQPEIVAEYNNNKLSDLMQDKGIIRNNLKINATIENARHFLKTQMEFGKFDNYIWQFTNHSTIKNKWKCHDEIPTRSVESDNMSKDLKKRGFKFVGTTICYAFMQAAGMINDHEATCFRYNQV